MREQQPSKVGQRLACRTPAGRAATRSEVLRAGLRLIGNGPVGTAWSAGDRVGMISVDGRLSDVRLRSDGS